jgi:hypothetical protein
VRTGLVVAQQIASAVLKEECKVTFDGKGSCIIGVGLKEAVQPAASFFEMPAPKIQFSMPSTAAHDAKTKELENWSRAVFN